MMTAEQGAEHVQHLLGAYVLNALPADEDLTVSQHLAICPDCAAEAAELQDVRRVLDRLNERSVARLLDTPVEPATNEPDAHERPPTGPPSRPGPAPSRPGSGPSRPVPARPGSAAATGPASTRPTAPVSSARPRAGRRLSRPYRVVLAAMAVALALGVGLGGWLANREPVDIRLAGAETDTQSGLSVWVTVVSTPDGAHVDALVEGLTVGQSYRLYAVGDRGESQLAVAWTARDRTQGVGGEIAIPIERLTTVTLTRSDDSVLVTVRLARP